MTPVAPTFAYLVKSKTLSNADRRVIALGNLAGELKASLEAAVRAAGLELLLTREPARAFIELERDGALVVLVDMATLGAEQFCKRARGTDRLRSVPVIGMSRHPNELGFARVFAWGADDLVPLGAVQPLQRRLIVLRDTSTTAATGFGQAVVAEATTQRRALVGRVLAQAGYDVKFAVDRGAVELYACQSETRLVVISAALGDPRRMIEAAARAGGLPTWIVTAEERSVARLASSLSGLDRVAVTSTSGSPEDVLFLANEIVFGKGPRRRELRALYATPVAFRPRGGDNDEYGFTYDGSPSGIYVRSLLPCETEEVELELRLPNRDDRVRLHGKVARRFAFGSASIASAPPGFGVKLEGPGEALGRWAQAFRDLISGASDALSDPPPRPKLMSTPLVGAAGLGAGDVPLAVPPATLTIESVVAPLPQAVLSQLEQGSDVAELLAATLDEQTLTAVGTQPVTIDAETLDVRDARPSEFAMPAVMMTDSPPAGLSSLAPELSKPSAVPQAESSRAPLPVPLPAPSAQPASPAAGEPAARLPLPAPAVSVARKPPPPSARGATKSSPRHEVPAEVVPPRAEQSKADTAALAGEAARAPAAPPDESDPHERPTLGPGDIPATAGLPDLAAADWDHDAKTTIRESRPDTEEVPRAAAPREAERSEPKAAPARSSPEPEPAARAAARPEPSAPDALRPEGSAPDASRPEPSAPDASRSEGSAPVIEVAPPKDPWAAPAWESSERSRPSAAARPVLEGDELGGAPASTGRPRRDPKRGLLVALGIVAVAVTGIVLAAVASRGTDAPTRAEQPYGEPAAAVPAGPAEPAATTGDVPNEPGTAPLATAGGTPPSNSAVAPAGTASAAASAPPAEPSAAPGSATATAATAAPAAPASAATPVPPVDLTRLRGDRAALFVRSSVQARVFVHGTDYGETNQLLTTTCGIRFVRIGRARGDFLEPGQSHVLRCGKLTELTIEPAPGK